jgi:hypothetical protein
MLTIVIQVFQRIWSARVVNERAAWELLSLVDQIHLWAITEFRTFVLEHLRPWHKFCDDNYILDWNSAYDISPELKRTRTCSDGEDLLLPSWVSLLSIPFQQKVQVRAKSSLAKALVEHTRRKGKGKWQENASCECIIDECSASQETTYTPEEFSDHLRDFHHYEENRVAEIKQCIDEACKKIKYEKEMEEKEERERFNGSARDVRARNNKRCLNGEERLNESSPNSFSRSNPGPSKRVKAA